MDLVMDIGLDNRYWDLFHCIILVLGLTQSQS